MTFTTLLLSFFGQNGDSGHNLSETHACCEKVGNLNFIIIMKKTLDLNQMALMPIDETEMNDITGGSLIGIYKTVISTAADAIQGLWDGFTQGLSQGAS